MSIGITWRLAEAADVPAINDLVARSIRGLHTVSYPEAIIEEAIDHAYGVDWQLIQDGTYFVAMIAETIVGAGGWSYRQTIAGAHAANEPAAAPLIPGRDAARIRAFYVDPAYVRHGVAALLLGVSENAARQTGFEAAELTSTFPAVPFYTALGYRPDRRFDLSLPSGAKLRLQLMSKNFVQGGN